MLMRTAFAPTKLRVVKCRQCREPFQKRSQLHTICSQLCLILAAEIKEAKAARKRATEQAKAEKADRVSLRARKLAIKPRKWWLKRAEAAFNEWVRTRDAERPCVSCGRHKATYDAGHYMTVGSCPELRFDEANVHKQCVQCNRDLHGNSIRYRARLLRLIGPAGVDRLEGPNAAKKYTIADLQAIHDTYKAKTKKALTREESTP
jgi:hypothetical protein